VVVAGEILPFVGGTGMEASSVRIKQVKSDIVAEYDTYTEALTDRFVEFGSNVGGVDTFTWSDFVRVKTNIELAAQYATKEELAAMSNLLLPKGGIIMWSGAIAAIPAGFTLCNGANVTGYGIVPDLRGRFIVGYDGDTLNLPAIVTEGRELNYGAIGNRGGKPDVQLNINQIPNHTHNFKLTLSTSDDGGVVDGNQVDAAVGGSDFSYTTEGAGGGQYHENRPPYYVLAYIIKVM